MQVFMHIHKHAYASSQYPKALREISSPPKQLFSTSKTFDTACVAIVGTRRPTPYGRRITYQLASELASAGVTIVSGLAIGIDTVAHQAALEANGRTIAVLGCGLNRIYPARNRELGVRITRNGALVSEYEGSTPALPHHFPARNRIISGLSQAVIVTEAAAESGSLITARFALEQNRQVLAVPGNITSLRSAGPNNLLRLGATPITSSADVLAALNIFIHAKPTPKASNKNEEQLMQLLKEGYTSSKDLIENSQLDASVFAEIISLMEIRGKVRSLGAGMWVLA